MFFETLCTKFEKNVINSVLWASLARRPSKTVRKMSFFFTFFEALLYKLLIKCGKRAFFWSLLLDVPQKVWENSVFSHFSRHFVESSPKMRKNHVFFLAFCAIVPQKKIRRHCYFHVFRGALWYKFRIKCEKTVFFEFLHDVPPNSVRKQCFFSRFSRKFVQNSRKMRKDCVFWTSCATFHKTCQENSFFSRFSRHFVQSSQKIKI